MLIRYLGLLVVLALAGCSPSAESQARKDSVIYVGMPYEAARAKLKAYGAEPGDAFDIALDLEAFRAGKRLQFSFLPRSGACLEIVSQPETTTSSPKAETHIQMVIGSLRVSTYKPKEIKYKLDPEQTRFFKSFVSLKEFDLADELNQIPPEPAPTTTGPR